MCTKRDRARPTGSESWVKRLKSISNGTRGEDQDDQNDHQDGTSVVLLASRNKTKSQANNRTLTTPRKREVLLSKISIYIVFMLVICHR